MSPRLVVVPPQSEPTHRLLVDLPSEPRLSLLLEAVLDENLERGIRAMAAETLRASFAKAVKRLEACATADEVVTAMLKANEARNG